MLDNSYYEHNKNYVGANIDAMVNLSTLFAGANPSRFFEVYGFAGPMLSVAKSQNVTIKNDGTMVPEGESKARARIGASAGVGLKFNINKYWLSMLKLAAPSLLLSLVISVATVKLKEQVC